MLLGSWLCYLGVLQHLRCSAASSGQVFNARIEKVFRTSPKSLAATISWSERDGSNMTRDIAVEFSNWHQLEGRVLEAPVEATIFVSSQSGFEPLLVIDLPISETSSRWHMVIGAFSALFGFALFVRGRDMRM